MNLKKLALHKWRLFLLFYLHLLQIGRWKSEALLFRYTVSIYEDAIYQYRDNWLGRLSLDIFIPSIKTAIEYQGCQHYDAVNYFGGEEHLKEQKYRDEMKRKLCEQKGINLIEWPYSLPIRWDVFCEKLNIENIDDVLQELKLSAENTDKASG